MRMLLVLAMLAVACGGSDKPLFRGDEVVAELRSGVPFCSPGSTGPTIATRTALTEGPTDTTADHPPPYTSTIMECAWTCGSINGIDRAFVYMLFWTQRDGSWKGPDAYADTIGAVAKADCPTD